MQGVTVSPPKEFLPLPGEPTFAWPQWKSYWLNYISAIASPQVTAPKRKTLLLHALGVEGLRVFEGLPQLEASEVSLDDDEHTISLKMLEKRFLPKVNVAVNRHKFYTRKQSPEEGVEEYVAVLRRLSLQCEFGNAIPLEELIRDQIIVHSNNSTIQNNLWMAGNPNLSDTIVIAKRVETSLLCAKELKSSEAKDDPNPAQKPAVGLVSNKKKEHRKTSKKPEPDTARKDLGGGRKCFRCGSPKHLANDRRCPAIKEVCSLCKQVGHFAKCCNRKKGNVALVEVESSSSDTDCNYVCSREQAEESKFHKSPLTKVKLNDVTVVMTLDSGSPFSFIPLSIWRTICEKTKTSLKLRKPDITPDAFGEFRINILGYTKALVEHQNKFTTSKIYIVEKGPLLLGWSDIVALDIKLNLSEDNGIFSVASSLELQLQDKFPKLFMDRLGTMKGFKHEIKEVRNAVPVVQAVRSLPPAWREEVKVEIERLLAENIIEHVNSSRWVSPLVVLRKPNGKLRVCVDLTELNNAIYIDRHPLPNITEMLADVKGSKFFTKLDLRQAYHQIKLTRSSRELTTFISPFGMFRYKRMPFGLASAAGVFQREMENILGNMKNVMVFQDDILIHSPDAPGHEKILFKVLNKLETAGLTIEISKCTFMVCEVEYLGHWVSGSGVRPKEKLVHAILDAKDPQNKDELRSFLGLGEYYSRFIRNFAEITFPLRLLLKKGVRFVWSEECASAYAGLKKRIGKFPELNHYQMGLKTILTVDASLKGLGAVLSQVEGGEEKTISFASRLLSDAESRYSVIERELLACKWAARKFKNYLWGCRFTLRTDHQPLVNVMTVMGRKRASPRIMRLLVGLIGFTFEVEYLPGVKNTIADCLSRLPVGEPDPRDEIDENELVAYVNNPKFLAINKEEWQSAYEADATLTRVSLFINQGWPDKRNLGEMEKPFYEVRNELSLINDWVCRGSLIVPPCQLRDRILELGHVGHLGISLTKRRVKQVYWWPGLDTSIEKLVRSCLECCNSDKVLKVRVQPMLPISPPSSPWSTLGIDILGPYHLTGENAKYVIVVVDYFSKWPEYKIVKRIDSGVILKFLTSIFGREGLPSVIISDNGPQFRSGEVNSFAKEMGISWKYSANYHPETNGLVERMNRVISESVQLSNSNNLNWEEALKKTIWSYRTTPHTITKVSPFKIMRGREPGMEFHPCWLNVPDVCDKVCENVQNRIVEAQGNYSARSDMKKGAKRVIVNVGDLVKIKKPEGSYRKGESKYSEPFKVIKIMSNSLQLENGKVWNLSRVAKVNPKKCTNRNLNCETQNNQQLLNLESSIVLPTNLTNEHSSDEHSSDVGESSRAVTSDTGGTVENLERRSERVRRPPKSLEEYVT